MSHRLRLVCPSFMPPTSVPWAGFTWALLDGGHAPLAGISIQVLTKPVLPCSLAALPMYLPECPGPGSVVLGGGSRVGQVLHPWTHAHSVVLVLGGRSCWSGLGGPPEQEG